MERSRDIWQAARAAGDGVLHSIVTIRAGAAR